MTESEAIDFITEAFIAFPAIGQWIKENSPQPAQTIDMYAKSLQCIELPEAISVLNRWVNGTLEPPTGYQKENFFHHVKAVVMADRSRGYAARQREEQFQKQNGRKRNESYLPLLGPFMRDVRAVQNEYESGLLSLNERDARIADLVREAHACVDAKVEYAARSVA